MSRNQNEREFLEVQPPTTPAAAVKVAQEIDARGISAPLPLLRAHRALRGMAPGEVLKVVTSHPQAVAEFQSMVSHVSGYELLGQEEAASGHVHLLRRRR
jgi:tRNA 2-thiouridine synthesizing protein A